MTEGWKVHAVLSKGNAVLNHKTITVAVVKEYVHVYKGAKMFPL